MSHPDASMTHSRTISRALRVDEGLWVVNSTFNLPQNRKKHSAGNHHRDILQFKLSCNIKK